MSPSKTIKFLEDNFDTTFFDGQQIQNSFTPEPKHFVVEPTFVHRFHEIYSHWQSYKFVQYARFISVLYLFMKNKKGLLPAATTSISIYISISPTKSPSLIRVLSNLHNCNVKFKFTYNALLITLYYTKYYEYNHQCDVPQQYFFYFFQQ